MIRRDVNRQFQLHTAAKALEITNEPFTYRRSPRLNKGLMSERFGHFVDYKHMRFGQTIKPRKLFD